MSETIKNAKAKIEKELKEFKGSQKPKAVSEHIASTLKKFCENEKFANAVLTQSKTLSDCCEEIMKNVGNSISDIQVYRKATAFYFPGSKIDFKMEIVIEGESLSANETDIPEDKCKASEPKPRSKKKEKTPDDTIQISLF